jgi:hypothetical protein
MTEPERLAARYSRYEIALEGTLDYENPPQDADVEVEFSHAAERRGVRAFWDGGRMWKVRFSPELEGFWQWQSRCSDESDAGLHDQRGEFRCVPGESTNPFCRHGSLRVSPGRRHLVHADGAPFFWLGDTVWNGPLKSSASDWARFLADRAQKGFSAIQFVPTQWISASGDSEGRPAWLGTGRIRIEPAFFRRLDRRVDAINEFGMVAAPVLAWTAGWNRDSAHLNPGTSLAEDQLILLIRYLVARYGAHQVVWILAGDGIYEGAEAERWRRIGRAALDRTNRLATMHPGGKLWVAPEFSLEPWFSFNGYQSGHWNDDDNSRWINEGPPSTGWHAEPRCPHINLEPCYEAHRGMATGRQIDAHDVRRACYWSLLASPTAGVTYGAHGVWSWESEPELPLSHPGTGIARPWHEAMHLPGSAGMAHLKAIFNGIDWWKLLPCPVLLAEQPGRAEPSRFIAAACSEARDLAVFYLPEGGSVAIRLDELSPGLAARCSDPATGDLLFESPAAAAIDTGGPRDRVLILSRS